MRSALRAAIVGLSLLAASQGVLADGVRLAGQWVMGAAGVVLSGFRACAPADALGRQIVKQVHPDFNDCDGAVVCNETFTEQIRREFFAPAGVCNPWAAYQVVCADGAPVSYDPAVGMSCPKPPNS